MGLDPSPPPLALSACLKWDQRHHMPNNVNEMHINNTLHKMSNMTCQMMWIKCTLILFYMTLSACCARLAKLCLRDWFIYNSIYSFIHCLCSIMLFLLWNRNNIVVRLFCEKCCALWIWTHSFYRIREQHESMSSNPKSTACFKMNVVVVFTKKDQLFFP